MNILRIVATRPDGTTADVTEAVQVIYDALHAGMDFSSGFLDAAEARAMYLLAHFAGWEPPEYSGDPCQCGHVRADHRWARIGERRPCRHLKPPMRDAYDCNCTEFRYANDDTPTLRDEGA